MFGSLSNANDSADSASILAVSVYPGSPPETSQRTDLPPPSPRKLTLNQLFARCAALGPSPLPRIFNKRPRVGLNWAAAAMAARSAARRVGKEWVSTGRSRGEPVN